MPPEKDKESGLSPEISRLSAVLARDPSSKLFMPLAEEYMKAMMVEEAIMTLEDGLKSNPFYMSARVLLGKAYVEKNNLDEALVQFEQVVKAIPDNLLAHRMLGSIYKSLGRYQDAIRSYRMISILSPKDEEARAMLEELESGKLPPVKPVLEDNAELKLETHRAEPQQAAGQTPQYIEAPVFDMSDAEPLPTQEAEIHETTEFLVEAQEIDDLSEGAPEDAFQDMPMVDMDTNEAVKFDFEPEPEPAIAPAEEYSTQEAQPLDDLDWEGEPSNEHVSEEPAVAAGSGYAVDFKASSGLDDIFSSYDGVQEEEGTPSGNKSGVYEITEDISSFDVEIFNPVQPEETVVDIEIGPEVSTAEPFETGTLAELYIAQGFYDRAIGIYKNLLVEDPGNNQIRQKLEDLYQLAGLSSSKAAVIAEKETAAAPAPVPFTGFDEEPAGIWGGAEEEIPVEEFSSGVEEAHPVKTPAQTDTAAIMRLEQFLTNIRKKAGR